MFRTTPKYRRRVASPNGKQFLSFRTFSREESSNTGLFLMPRLILQKMNSSNRAWGKKPSNTPSTAASKNEWYLGAVLNSHFQIFLVHFGFTCQNRGWASRDVSKLSPQHWLMPIRKFIFFVVLGGEYGWNWKRKTHQPHHHASFSLPRFAFASLGGHEGGQS